MKSLCPFCNERPIYKRSNSKTCGSTNCRKLLRNKNKRRDYSKNPAKFLKYTLKIYHTSKGPGKLEKYRKYHREWKRKKRIDDPTYRKYEAERMQKVRDKKQAEKLYLQQKVFNLDEGLLPLGVGNFM